MVIFSTRIETFKYLIYFNSDPAIHTINSQDKIEIKFYKLMVIIMIG